MRTVFLLQHVHDITDMIDDVKIIGVYSSEKLALAAQERAMQLPGFRDTPKGFHVDAYVVDEDNWVEGFVTA